MKKLVFFAVLLLFSVGLASAAVEVIDNERIVLSLVSQTPDPVQPGGFFDARFKLENNGSVSAENLEFKVVPEFPFSFYGDSSVYEAGTLGGFQRGLRALLPSTQCRFPLLQATVSIS